MKMECSQGERGKGGVENPDRGGLADRGCVMAYKVKALCDWMFCARTERLCSEFWILPGKFYTFGRSQKGCDVIFLDNRVSRHHCQIYLEPQSHQVVLLDGAPGLVKEDMCAEFVREAISSETRNAASGAIQVPCSNNSSDEKLPSRSFLCNSLPRDSSVNTGGLTASGRSNTEGSTFYKNSGNLGTNLSIQALGVCSEVGFHSMRTNFISECGTWTDTKCETADQQLFSYMLPLSLRARRASSSLNGLYLNGKKIRNGSISILQPGAVVSLVTSSKGGSTLDPGFGDTVGFVVVAEYANQTIYDGQSSSIAPFPHSCKHYKFSGNEDLQAHTWEINCDLSTCQNALHHHQARIPTQGNMTEFAECRSAQELICSDEHLLLSCDAPMVEGCELSRGERSTAFQIQRRKKRRRAVASKSKQTSTECQGGNDGDFEVSLSSTLRNLQHLRARDQHHNSTSQFLSVYDCALSRNTAVNLFALSEERKEIIQESKRTDKMIGYEGLQMPSPILTELLQNEEFNSSKVRKTRNENSTTGTARKLRSVRNDVEKEPVCSKCAKRKIVQVQYQDCKTCKMRGERQLDMDGISTGKKGRSMREPMTLTEPLIKMSIRNLGHGSVEKLVHAPDWEPSVVEGDSNLQKRQVGQLDRSYIAREKEDISRMRDSTKIQYSDPDALNMPEQSLSNKIVAGLTRDDRLASPITVEMQPKAFLEVSRQKEQTVPERPYCESALDISKSAGLKISFKQERSAVYVEEREVVVECKSWSGSANQPCRAEEADIRIKLKEKEDLTSKGNKCTAILDKGRTRVNVNNASNHVCLPHGFCLNRLEGITPVLPDMSDCISLQELLAPVEGLLSVFAATFTSDIPWFLSSNNIPQHLPVTIACHDYKKCWNESEGARSLTPLSDWPNVTVIYPPFPDACRFKTEKGGGVGCHHPKFFLLRFQEFLRVVVTSANLNRRQWENITNTVWWQDFPFSKSKDYQALFPSPSPFGMEESSSDIQNDFVAQLSSFVASLIVDVPSQAHWAVDMAEYDFTQAAASLITSVPGLHGCPCPPAPRSILNYFEDKKVNRMEFSHGRELLSVVRTAIVGIGYRFSAKADPKGERLRALSAILGDSSLREDGRLVVVLKRSLNVPADANAVSVIVCPKGVESFKGMLDMKDSDANLDCGLPGTSGSGSVHLGFLSRKVATWMAPLYDSGLCSFAACVWPGEALGVASGQTKVIVELVVYVFKGVKFSNLSRYGPLPEQTVALSSLLQSSERPFGLRRLQKVLSRNRWKDSDETEFIFGSSSVGTSLDASFLAAFSAAAGRKSKNLESVSDESDPEWGSWTAQHEAHCPSIGLIFPTIERVKAAKDGPISHRGILCFAESTWERLKAVGLLRDAVPQSPRVGIPMHVKVARRRFQSHPQSAPYGWVYCGSHNFSPAAWGRPLRKCRQAIKCSYTGMGHTLLISNYELGLLFIEPPHVSPRRVDLKRHRTKLAEVDKSDLCGSGERQGLDQILLPFLSPAPRYIASDQPATAKAMYGALCERRSTQLPDGAYELDNCDEATELSEVPEEGLNDFIEDGSDCGESCNQEIEKQEDEELWTQIESCDEQLRALELTLCEAAEVLDESTTEICS